MTVPTITRHVPILAPAPNSLSKYMMDNISDVNLRRLSTRFKVKELATAVILFTPAMHAYLYLPVILDIPSIYTIHPILSY